MFPQNTLLIALIFGFVENIFTTRQGHLQVGISLRTLDKTSS